MRVPRRSIVALVITLLIAVSQSCTGGADVAPTARVERALARRDTNRAIRVLRGIVSDEDATPERFMRLGALYRSRRSITSRLRSQETLQQGLRRYPDHTGLLVELGKTYYEQTFYPDAARCFKRVLALDWDHCEAHYYLGLNWYRKWKHVQVYMDYLPSASVHLQHVVECDPANASAHYRLAFITYAQGDTTGTLELCNELLVRHPNVAEAIFLRGVVAYEQARFEDAKSLFDSALALMSEEERRAHSDIILLLDDDTLEDYLFLGDDKRDQMRHRYWAEHDPDLTTPLNERYLEHLYRMFLADAFYSHAAPLLRGWETERGRALVKFGWPAEIASTLEGDFLSGRMERWRYGDERAGFTLFFRDEFLNGNYIVPMDYDFVVSAQTLFLETPATSLRSPYAEVPGTMELLAFRDDSEAALYLAVKIDRDSLVRYTDLDSVNSFVARVAIFDDRWQPQLYSTDTLRVPTAWRDPSFGDGYVYLVRAAGLPFDHHRAAFSLQDDGHSAKVLVQADNSTVSLLSDSLRMSDVLLHRGQSAATARSGASVFRRGRHLYPNPGGVYHAGDKLHVYVEIYNLAVLASSSEYDITYSIYARQPQGGTLGRLGRGLKRLAGFRSRPEPVISQTVQRRHTGYEARENLAIDIGALPLGEFVLDVSVQDRRSGQAAERSRRFVKVAAGDRSGG